MHSLPIVNTSGLCKFHVIPVTAYGDIGVFLNTPILTVGSHRAVLNRHAGGVCSAIRHRIVIVTSFKSALVTLVILIVL